ncbi:MAG: alpha/beta hydrolase [Actinomycetota bacterium]
MTELLGANTDTLDRMAQSLRVDSRAVQDIRARAQQAVAELEAAWNGPDLWHLTQQWEQQTLPQLANASTGLEMGACKLLAQSSAQRAASSADDGGAVPGWPAPFAWMAPGAALGIPGGTNPAGTAPTGPPTPTSAAGSPPQHASPRENADWWRSLSAREQQDVIRGHPDWVGNRDGVPFTVRNVANRALLSLDKARLVVEGARLAARLADDWFDGTFTNDDVALAHAGDKLASLDAIEQTLARDGERQLLLLDLSQERAQAAIARGDVDNADNVAVLVPGMTANVNDKMMGYDHEMDHLQHRAELENKRVHPTGSSTTATVTWIGYQAPQLGWDLIGQNSAADDHAAQVGAAHLVPFLQGIGAARTRDAHLTLLGHSYGSTTAGLALRQSTGVDDVVFFGSPGVGTSNVRDLAVPSGHTYYIEARLDPVGDLGHFGIDPSHMDGVGHVSARESTVVDPLTGEVRHFAGISGHSSYLVDDSTSQFNMSVVVAGVPERRVLDPGEGLGDLLSWPIPGTHS